MPFKCIRLIKRWHWVLGLSRCPFTSQIVATEPRRWTPRLQRKRSAPSGACRAAKVRVVCRTGVNQSGRQGCAHGSSTVSYTHLRAHETVLDLVCRLLLEKKK